MPLETQGRRMVCLFRCRASHGLAISDVVPPPVSPLRDDFGGERAVL